MISAKKVKFSTHVLGLAVGLLAPSAIAQTNYATPYTFTTLAGTSGQGHADGMGSAARFNGPVGTAVDSAGNVYVADSGNSIIRKITPVGAVTTLAGTAGQTGSADGTGSAARFKNPVRVAVDSSGNVYVADQDNFTIRKITQSGVVTTMAGTAGVYGSADGLGAAAQFSQVSGVAVDRTGNVYVTDFDNYTIRKITPAGLVTTLAGTAGLIGSADGVGATARFSIPVGLGVDQSGNVYVADNGNQTIRKITPAGLVTTLAGSVGQSGSADGTGGAAGFFAPTGVAVDNAGNVYVADKNNDTIRKITPAGVVTTLAGSPGQSGSADGTGSAAQFNTPNSVAVDTSGNVYVADTVNSTIRTITSAGVVSTLAGQSGVGSADGTGGAARFGNPRGMAVDSAGNVFVADTGNDTIRIITPAGVVTTLAGGAGQAGSADGVGSAARFNGPLGVAVDGGGNVYVADTGNFTVRKITSGGAVTTLAGTAGLRGTADGTGAAARFNYVFDVAVDRAGNVYVADASNSIIRKITPAGVVTTLAGTVGVPGKVDGTGSAAQFGFPIGVAVDGAGIVYVADLGNSNIREITPVGAVTTLAGSVGQSGSADGTGSAARFNGPYGAGGGGAADVYVADTGNSTIRKIANGVVTTVAGVAGVIGSGDGTGSAAQFDFPQKVAVDGAGNIYVADTGNSTIRKGVPASGLSITSQPQSQTVNTGSSVVLTVGTTPPSALTYLWYFNGNPISGATLATLSLTNVQAANAGAYQVSVSDSFGYRAPSANATLTVSSAAPSVITAQPVSQAIATNSTVVFTVTAGGSVQTSSIARPQGQSAMAASGTTYQWQFNGVNLIDGNGILGSTGPQLVIQRAGAANNGDYSCVVTSAGVAARSNSAGLVVGSVSNPGYLINISARAFVGAGDGILIGGFYIVGSTSRTVLIQALGPALSSVGVTGVLQHPALGIHDSTGATIYSNTGWGSSPILLNAAVAAYANPPLVPNSGDSELLLTLPPGGYTAEISGADGGTGIALCAIYQMP